jgi:hypothetical protein
VALYNRALSEQEVLENYAAGRVFDSPTSMSKRRVIDGLVTLYLFSEGRGERILDRSGKSPPADLRIPSWLIFYRRGFLSSPYRDFTLASDKFIRDTIGNIVIFVPFGFLFHAALRSRYQSSVKIAASVLTLGAIFTLSIESLQYFSDTRYSSMTDVINNVVGTALGIVIDESRAYFVKSL